jgi:peptide/nickel transport system permease protein
MSPTDDITPLPMRTTRGRASIRAGLFTLVALASLATFAPRIAPHSPTEQNLSEDLRGSSVLHPLGQDKLGRDQLSRIIYGARVSLLVGVTSVTMTVTLGVLIGALAGYAGGTVDFWVMRIVDVLLAFPGILLAIAMSAVLGPSLPHVIFALSVIGWTGYARLVRAEVLAIREREHVEAARALGMRSSRVVLRHILPLVAAPVAVQATFGMAGAIVAEASLSFLGLGVQPPTPSWGSMLNEGRSFLLIAPHLTLWPGVAIFVTVLGLNLLGDGLRARLDVRGH